MKKVKFLKLAGFVAAGMLWASSVSAQTSNVSGSGSEDAYRKQKEQELMLNQQQHTAVTPAEGQTSEIYNAVPGFQATGNAEVDAANYEAAKTARMEALTSQVNAAVASGKHIILKSEFETMPAEKQAHITGHPELYMISEILPASK